MDRYDRDGPLRFKVKVFDVMVQFLDVEIIEVDHPETNDLNVVNLQLSEQEVEVGLHLTHLILSILSISLTIHVMHG